MPEFVSAMKVSDLAEGSMAALDVKGVHVLLAKIGGEVSAVEGICTHEEADLGLGFMIEDRVVCPLHLSQFNLKTGQVLSPPAEISLKRFNVKIEDETIFVEV
ncbi:MAG TPA: non-heme iron oxygenase ferredoxin subunit [Nitrososphaerales archaeon]|jgi:3-phenylpropionate/trans-cinnamate dioxygenase ferredoxin subunit|nr:non-heme iron oxygenase ferredoxin subunit [Nitrososphaerales archaeon]